MISYSGKTPRTVNYLKTIYFDHPAWTPAAVGMLPATWMHHRQALEDLVLEHPRVFPGFKKGQVDFDFKTGMWAPMYELGRCTDCWGTVWENICRGMDAQVAVEPLDDWSKFDAWKKHLPDPMRDAEFGPRDWARLKTDLDAAKARGQLAAANPLMHGHFFMRLYYLRGFENLMVDLATDDPQIHALMAIVLEYNLAAIAKCLALGAEMITFGEDLGMQTSLPISPAMWRQLVKPAYEAMCGPCRDRDVPVYLHSDGHILEIIPDLIETGVRVLNPQIRANGLEGLQKMARGKVALNQDLDRQLFPFVTPSQIEDHIAEVFEGLYLPQGGLMLLAECGPDVPLKNIDAICKSFEKLCNLPEPSIA